MNTQEVSAVAAIIARLLPKMRVTISTTPANHDRAYIRVESGSSIWNHTSLSEAVIWIHAMVWGRE